MQSATNNNLINVKSDLKGDIRRFQAAARLSDIAARLQEIYNIPAGFDLKYKDDEGDLVSLSSDADLGIALQICPGLLRVSVVTSRAVPYTLKRCGTQVTLHLSSSALQALKMHTMTIDQLEEHIRPLTLKALVQLKLLDKTQVLKISEEHTPSSRHHKSWKHGDDEDCARLRHETTHTEPKEDADKPNQMERESSHPSPVHRMAMPPGPFPPPHFHIPHPHHHLGFPPGPPGPHAPPHPWHHAMPASQDSCATQELSDPENLRGRGWGGRGRGGRGGRGRGSRPDHPHHHHHHAHHPHHFRFPHHPAAGAEHVPEMSDTNEENECTPRSHRKRMIARLVKHLTIPDGEILSPGAHLAKTWRLRNDTDVEWPENCEIVCVSGDTKVCDKEAVAIRGKVAPGQEIDVSVPIRVPDRSGTYQAFFRLREVGGKKFGQRVWVNFTVPASSSSSENDDFIAVAHDDPRDETNPEFEQALSRLAEMGFTDHAKNVQLLARYHGNVERAVGHLSDKP